MRILAVTNMYPTDAAPWAGTFVEQQIASLRRSGVTVDLLFVDRLGRGLRAYWGLAAEVRRRVRKIRPDLVHVMYGGWMSDVVTRALRDVPVVVSFCGSDLLGQREGGWIRRVAARYGVLASGWAALRAVAVIVKSESLRRALPSGLDPARVWLIPNGIDLDRFRPLDPARCREKLGWDPRMRHVLFPASPDNRVKRFPLAAAAVERLRQEGMPIEIHALRGVPHSEVPVWLNAADCLLLTSEHEGSPNIVKEALACNRPVVSVDVGDVRQRLAGVSGCVVSAADPGSLASSLAGALAASPSEGRPTGRSAVGELSLEVIAARVLGVYVAVREAFGASNGEAANRANRSGAIA